MSIVFNPNQLATWQQAKDLAAQIDSFRQATGVNMGGGVVPVTTDPEPNDAANNEYWLRFRFANGRSGVNVGLILDKIRRYGGNTLYVFYSINSNDLS